MRVLIKKVSKTGISYQEGGKVSLPRSVDYVGAGGTHEQNPHGGVPYGIANDGIPNLVEQGETIYDDYVFSKRNKPTKADLKKAGLKPSFLGKSFADISLALSKEAGERRNDEISENGLRASLTKLRVAQEARNSRADAAKQKREAKKQAAAMIAMQQANEYQKALQAQQLANALRQSGQQYANGGLVHLHNDGKSTENTEETASNVTKGIYYGDRDAQNLAYLLANQQNDNTSSEWIYNYNINNDVISDNANWNNYRNYILKHWDDKEVQNAMSKWWEMWKKYNIDNKYSDKALSRNIYEKLSSDGKQGFGYIIGQDIVNLYNKAMTSAANGKYGEEAEKAKQDFISGLSVTKNDLDLPENRKMLDTSMRYAPLLGNLSAIAGTAGGPDHSISDAMLNASATPTRQAEFNTTSDYLTYNPIDTDMALNKYMANNNANRQTIVQSTAGTGNTLAALLAANRQNSTGFGDALTSIREYNDKQRQDIGQFNAATNQFNSSGLSNTSQYNAGLAANRDKEYVDSVFGALRMRDDENTAYQDARSTNLTALYQNLGNIGRENFNSNMVTGNQSLAYGVGQNGQTNYLGTPVTTPTTQVTAGGKDGGYLMTRTRRKTKKRRR